MGYLDRELGIKSVKGIEKYIKQYFKDKDIFVDLECMKNPKCIRCFWAIDNYLHKFDIEDSFVIYVVKEEGINKLIEAIEASLKQRA